MPDLYMQALMQGKSIKKNTESAISNEKNRFELQTEKEIETFAASLSFDEDPTQSHLTNPEMKRAKVIAELKEQAKLTELSSFVEDAFKILASEGEK
ncbi:MAG: hypothetical protein H0U49_07895, partial [Parachlamydiaceae bacterium]|nr:hypothetical protein [Parachlamydiaceae bacterium]